MTDFERVRTALAGAQKILVFTGAGISTGSGIPDFRGPQGVWKKRKPVTIDAFLTTEEARHEYWDYKLEGYQAFQQARPNAAHRALVTLQEQDRLAGLVTQNVDGLHSLAGIKDENLIEIHGTNRKIRCLTCQRETDPPAAFAHFQETGKAPSCEECGGWLKPATISFGQRLVDEDLERGFEWAKECDFAVSLGSTLSVYPAASVPSMAAGHGKPYLIINQGKTDQDHLATFRLEGDLVELVPRLL